MRKRKAVFEPETTATYRRRRLGRAVRAKAVRAAAGRHSPEALATCQVLLLCLWLRSIEVSELRTGPAQAGPAAQRAPMQPMPADAPEELAAEEAADLLIRLEAGEGHAMHVIIYLKFMLGIGRVV